MGTDTGEGAAALRLGRSLEDFHLRLLRAFQAQRSYFQPEVASLGLGPGQPKLLVYLAVHGPSSQREVAVFFETDPGAVSRMFESLARAGFVTDAPGPDRRTKLRDLTPSGRAAVEAWELACDREQDVMLRGFSARERERFADYLARARANLRSASGAVAADVAATDPAAPEQETSPSPALAVPSAPAPEPGEGARRG